MQPNDCKTLLRKLGYSLQASKKTLEGSSHEDRDSQFKYHPSKDQQFKKIEHAYPGKKKVHILCDNALYYGNKVVNEFLVHSKIELHFVPPYNPNLNPIERLWKWMKERVIYNTYYQYFEEFRSAVLGFLGLVSGLDPERQFEKKLLSKVRDQFIPIDLAIK
ncbi:MAG: transposase [Candidatus Neptunochlamydia sp.]|nr:transposase [Candidatus Neptunochlamydia sp.]